MQWTSDEKFASPLPLGAESNFGIHVVTKSVFFG